MVTLTITHSDDQRSIVLSAETMRELVDEKLPMWLPSYKDDEKLLKMSKEFRLYGKTFLKAEKRSGWYYDC